MLEVSGAHGARSMIAPYAILMKPSNAHNLFSGYPGLSQRPIPAHTHRVIPRAAHAGPKDTAMGKKCRPTAKRIAKSKERSPAGRYIATATRTRMASTQME